MNSKPACASLHKFHLAVLMDSWISGTKHPTLTLDIDFEDLASMEYVGDDPLATSIEVVDGNYLPQWEAALSHMVEIFIDESPTDLPEGKTYTCRQDYDNYKAGLDSDLFKEVENGISDLIYDYLVNVKGETL